MTNPICESLQPLTALTFLATALPLCFIASAASAEDAGGEPADALPGLAFVLFNDTEFQRPAEHGVEEQLNMELTGYNDCSKLWLGAIRLPVTGETAFEVETDAGVRLYADGKLVIDGWSRDGARRGTVRGEAGRWLPVRLEYWHLGGVARMRLHWSWEGQPRELVPASAFRYSGADRRHMQAVAEGREWVAPGNQGPVPTAGLASVSAPAGDEVAKASVYRPGREGAAHGEGPVRLGSGPHLFLDDYLIDSSTGVTRRVNRPERDPGIPNPTVTGREDRNFQPYLTVLRDPTTGRFRLWYGAWDDSKGAATSHIGYLESEDGIHWIRPFRLLTDPAPIQFGDSVIDDGPACADPAQRYKLGWWSNGGLKIAYSADGLGWTPLAPFPVLRHNHDITNLFRDSLRDRYVATVSVYTTGPTWSGTRRVTMQSTSADLLHWEKPWYILTPVEGIDEGETQFYCMNGHLIRGDLWIGLVKVLRDDLRASGTPEGAFGIGYTTLAWTRDGEHWVRDPEPFFEPDPAPGAWDHAHAWMDYQLPVGDEVFLYYGGYKNGHKMNRFEERQLGLVRMRRDRYVSREAGASRGTLRTPVVTVDGTRMTVNAKVAGDLRVRILDEAGKPLPGFDFADCPSIRGDSVAHPVRWNAELASLRGRAVRIEFALEEAQLYAFGLY
jgi:hypothetical protein